MKKDPSAKLSPVHQNFILGTVGSVIFGYTLRAIFQFQGVSDIYWVIFIALGPILGYFSGRERARMERLKREKAELELNIGEIKRSLALSTKKYRLLVENANDAIFLTTLNGKFLLFNEATCLLSGYSKSELKNMTLNQLQVSESDDVQKRKAWLDNGVYRYEEDWKTKSGNIISLSINSRWIQMNENRLVLHIARDVVKQKEVSREDEAAKIKKLHEHQLIESATMQRTIFSLMTEPLTSTLKTINYLSKQYTDEEEKLSALVKEWNNIRAMLKVLPSKNARDLTSSPTKWNFNDIVNQEIQYLKATTGSNLSFLQTTFAPDLPMVYGMGREFSVGVGFLLRAMIKALEIADRKELSVSTHSMDEHVMLEIWAPIKQSISFELCKLIDPFYDKEKKFTKEDEKQGLAVYDALFSSFSAKMDIGQEDGKGTIIRVRVPKTKEGKSITPKTTHDKIDDTLII